jgi:hypothetical protein
MFVKVAIKLLSSQDGKSSQGARMVSQGKVSRLHREQVGDVRSVC